MESGTSKKTTNRGGLGRNSVHPRHPQRDHSNTQPQSQAESHTARLELAEIENLNSKFENLPQMKDTSARIDKVLNDIQKAKQTLKEVRIEGLTNDLDEREVQLSTASEALNHNKTSIDEKLKEVKDTVEQSLEQASTIAQNILSKDENSSNAKELKLQLASVKKQIQDLISQKEQAYGYNKTKHFKEQILSLSEKTEQDLQVIVQKIRKLGKDLDQSQDVDSQSAAQSHSDILNLNVTPFHDLPNFELPDQPPKLQEMEKNLTASIANVINRIEIPEELKEQAELVKPPLEFPLVLKSNEDLQQDQKISVPEIPNEGLILEQNLTKEEDLVQIKHRLTEQSLRESKKEDLQEEEEPEQAESSLIHQENIVKNQVMPDGTPQVHKIPQSKSLCESTNDRTSEQAPQDAKIKSVKRYHMGITTKNDVDFKSADIRGEDRQISDHEEHSENDKSQDSD